jgi:ATP-binding cassette subfamily B protein
MKHLFTFFSKKDKKLLLTILFVRLIQTLGDFVQPLMLLVIFEIINPSTTPIAELNPFMQAIVGMSRHFVNMFNGDQTASLSIVFVIMTTGALFTLASGAISNVLTAKIGMGFGYNIRDKYYNKVQSLSASDIDKFSISSLTTRMTTDITMIQNVFIRSLSIIPRAIALFVGSIVFAFFINPIYGAYFLGALILLILIL